MRDPAVGLFNVRLFHGRVVSELRHELKAGWIRLQSTWARLQRKTSIVAAVGIDADILLLDYVLYDWGAPAAKMDSADGLRLGARWILELIEAYRALSEEVPDDIGLFWNPVLGRDLDAHLRLTFRPEPLAVNLMPPELLEKRPTWDERTIVFMIGTWIKWLVDYDRSSRIAKILEACVEPRPRRRWKKLDDLVHRIESLGFKEHALLAREEPAGWCALEEGYSWLEAGEYKRAIPLLTAAADHARYRDAANAAITKARDRIVDDPPAAVELPPVTEPAPPPDDAPAHYARGKQFLRQGRLHEARVAFERALELDATLLAAFLLRREVDRAIANNRRQIGDGAQPAIRLPESLERLRDVMLAGDPTAIAAALRVAPYNEDADAQLVLASFVTVEEAHEIYDRLAEGPSRPRALLAKAELLLRTGSTTTALAMLDALAAEQPTDVHVIESRARALERLGRLGEAAAEFRRFISLSTSRSDIRVRAAHDWLRDHPL